MAAVPPESRATDPVCRGTSFPFRVGGRWAGMIVVGLADGPLRFTELRAHLGLVTAKVLTETLRAMQRDGLVQRHDHGTRPPRVDYALTDLGRTLLPVISSIRDWGDEHFSEVEAHRRGAEAPGDHGVGGDHGAT